MELNLNQNEIRTEIETNKIELEQRLTRNRSDFFFIK